MSNASIRSNAVLPQFVLASLLSIVVVSATSQAATTIVNSFGFEASAGYELGALENYRTSQGQQYWKNTGSSAGGNLTSTATVQNSASQLGTQDLRVFRGANSDERWAVPVGTMGFPQNRYILIDWDMAVPTATVGSGLGPFFGVEAYDESPSSLALLGSLGVDSTTGEVLYQAYGSGAFVATSETASNGGWHHYQMKLDFGLNQYQVLFDDTPLKTIQFVDSELNAANFSHHFSDADIAALASDFSSASQLRTGAAFFDNFLVRNVDRADFDLDGDVDSTDLSIWEGSYGRTNGLGAGDANFDGDTNGADFLIWQREFSNGVAPLSAPLTAVPEPSAVTLLLLACCFVGVRRF